jgi:hypothetical protein
MLSKRYAPPEYGTFFEVTIGNRRADMIALGIWQSRGYSVDGFEIKVRRQDWLKEKKNPEKAEHATSLCDAWWVVAPEGIVPVAELPEPWGLLVPKMVAGQPQLHTVKKAARKMPFDRQADLPRYFVASMLRKVADTTIPRAEHRTEINRLVEEGIEAKRGSDAYQLKRVQEELSNLRKKISEFETRSGVRLNEWNAGDIGDAVAAVLSMRAYGLKPLESLANLARSFVRDYEALAATVPRGTVDAASDPKR